MTEDIFEKIVALRNSGLRSALATIIARRGATPRKDSAKMLIDEKGGRYGAIGGGSVEETVYREALAIIRSGSSKILNFDLTGVDVEEDGLVCGGHMEVYVEPIVPDPVLYIFGAGNVCRALSEIAGFAGFRVTVLDDRKKYVNSERFPRAEKLYPVESWETAFLDIELNDNSYIFISTREHDIDAKCVHRALKSPVRYIGMLGSLTKIELLKEYIKENDMDIDEFRRVSVPVGFDVGAETPEEIAVSIVVELIAARRNRDVMKIRDAVRNCCRP